MDEEAVIMAEHLIEASDGGTTVASLEPEEKETYTQAEIGEMTKADILALGTRLGYTMTTTETNTKEQIVADFMAQQAAAQGA